MCSPSSKHRRSALVKSPISVPLVLQKPPQSPTSSTSTTESTSTTCCWGRMATKSRSAARKLVKKYRRHPRKNVQVYTVNSKRSIKEACFQRLKVHVPGMSSKDNPTKLEVILEAISYIQKLKQDLEAEQPEQTL